MKTLISILTLAMLAACAPVTKQFEFTKEQKENEAAYQRRLAVQHEITQRQKLADAMYRLSVAAAPDCRGGQPLAGFDLGGADMFRKDFRDAGKQLGFDQQAMVMTVAKSSPAFAAGIRAGDRLLAVNGEEIRESDTAYRKAARLLAEALPGGVVMLTLSRDGKSYQASIRAEQGCMSEAFLTREVIPAPKANGKAALVPYSLVRTAKTEDEVAALAAFAMAINIKGLQPEPQDISAAMSVNRDVPVLMGYDEDNLFRPRDALSAGDVKTADKFAVELLRRAGFSSDAAVGFWRHILVTTIALKNDNVWGKGLLGTDRLARMKGWAGELK